MNKLESTAAPPRYQVTHLLSATTMATAIPVPQNHHFENVLIIIKYLL